MSKLAWFQFYPGDWMKDANLRRCSHAARGVWIDMVCLMFECEDRGVLQTAGRAWSDDEIAQAVGGRPDVTVACVVELLAKGVAHRNGNGAVYSKRMVRDQETRAAKKANGTRGGEASSSKRQANLKQDPKHPSVSDSDSGLSLFLIQSDPSFSAAWTNWLEYRRSKGKPVSDHAAKQQLAKCQAWGVAASVAAIEKSICNDWQGLFEPDQKASPAPQQVKAAPDFLRMAEQAAAQPRDPRRMNL